MIHRPLVHEFPVPRRPREQHPSRAAALRLPHRGKLGSPTLDTAKVPHKGIMQCSLWLTSFAERSEKEFVEDHRIGCDRSEEHTSELQSRRDLVCRLLLEKKKQQQQR